MFIKIKFVNEDPGEWGELRAYGAQWVRRINRTEVKRGVRSESSVQLVTRENLARVVDIEDLDLPVNARKHLPQWPRPYRPTYDEELRKGPALLGNDQHIEIFQSKPVPKVPRSYPDIHETPDHRHLLIDPKVDTSSYDDPAATHRRQEIDLENWDIFGRDEPACESPVQPGEFVEYYHAAEVHVRQPGTVHVLARRKCC